MIRPLKVNFIISSSLSVLLSFKISKSIASGQIDPALIIDLHYLNYDLIAYGNNVLYLFNSLLVKL